MMTSLLAVIPAVVAPLALLAMLLPVLFAGPLRVLQRWWVFFNVCTVSAALYVARFTFLGVRRRLAQSDAWWASPLAFWFALALVAGAGATWVWRRWRAGSPTAPDPGVGEQMVLGLVSLTGLGLVGYSLWDQGLRLYPVQAICTVPLVGWGYAVYLHRHVRQRSATKPLLPTPGVMLITLALIYIVIGVATRFGGGDGDVLSAGASEVQAASRACASQSAPPKT